MQYPLSSISLKVETIGWGWWLCETNLMQYFNANCSRKCCLQSSSSLLSLQDDNRMTHTVWSSNKVYNKVLVYGILIANFPHQKWVCYRINNRNMPFIPISISRKNDTDFPRANYFSLFKQMLTTRWLFMLLHFNMIRSTVLHCTCAICT